MENLPGASLPSDDVSVDLHAEQVHEREMFHSILARLPDAVLILDRAWRIVFANEEARRLSRIQSEDINGRTYWEIFPETIGTELERVLRQSMKTGEQGHVEHFYRPFDLWTEATLLPVPSGIAVHYRDSSARKKAEALHNTCATRLTQVLDATTDAIVGLDRDWNYTILNQRAVQLLRRNDLLGKNLWQEFPAVAGSTFSEHFHRAMFERRSVEFEAFYPEPLNTWFAVQGQPSDDGIVLFFRDISSRRLSETRFREQRALMTFVQQAARIAFWTIDLTTFTITFDVGSYPVFGHPFEAVQGLEGLRAIAHPHDLPRMQREVKRSIQTGELVVIEFRVFDHQRRPIWLEARAQARLADGKATTFGGMAIDITARKRNEEALAASEERYRILTELNPQFIWTGSSNGQVTYANQGCLDFLGLRLDGIQNGCWLDAVHPEDRALVLDRWNRSSPPAPNTTSRPA